MTRIKRMNEWMNHSPQFRKIRRYSADFITATIRISTSSGSNSLRLVSVTHRRTYHKYRLNTDGIEKPKNYTYSVSKASERAFSDGSRIFELIRIGVGPQIHLWFAHLCQHLCNVTSLLHHINRCPRGDVVMYTVYQWYADPENWMRQKSHSWQNWPDMGDWKSKSTIERVSMQRYCASNGNLIK